MINKKAIQILVLSFCCLSLSACMSISKEAAGLKANTYITDNLLQDNLKSEVDSVTDKGSFYEVDLRVTKDGEATDSAKVFVSKDGSMLSIGPTYNLNKSHKEQTQDSNAAAKAADIPKKDKPTVEMYVMSGCPFGTMAEESFQPVMELLGDKVEFTPRFIFYKNYQGGGPKYCLDKENQFCSMHGVEEAREDIRQICIWNKQRSKWWKYIEKFNKECSISAAENETKKCFEKVAKEVGIDVGKINKCVENSAEELAAKELALTEENDVSGSPTILINGAQYNGSRAPNSILSTICNSFKGKQPKECEEKIKGGDVDQASAGGGCGR
jgi:glutaredoxin